MSKRPREEEAGGENSAAAGSALASKKDENDIGGGDEPAAKKVKADSRRFFAVVCSSNMNRSMEAHLQFERKGLRVYSYGVGSVVRLPGPDGQNIFDFGTPYTKIRETIRAKPKVQEWFQERGLMSLLDRNVKIKDHPERLQDDEKVSRFDVIFCFEERVFDLVMEDLQGRDAGDDFRTIHIINLDVKDNPEEAIMGAQVALNVCELIDKADDLDDAVDEIIEEMEAKHNVKLMHATHFL